MPCKVVFWLYNEGFGLHLGSSTAKVYFCNQDSTASLFLSQLACYILNLANKHGITDSSIHFYLAQCGSHFSVLGKVDSRVTPASSHNSDCLSPLRSTRGRSVVILIHQSMSALLHLGKLTNSGSLGFECFQPPQDISYQLCVSSSLYSSNGSVQDSVRTCHKSIQTSYSSGTLLDGGSLASHSSQHVGRHSSLVSHHIILHSTATFVLPVLVKRGFLTLLVWPCCLLRKLVMVKIRMPLGTINSSPNKFDQTNDMFPLLPIFTGIHYFK